MHGSLFPSVGEVLAFVTQSELNFFRFGNTIAIRLSNLKFLFGHINESSSA
jgi:hypothetical protein